MSVGQREARPDKPRAKMSGLARTRIADKINRSPGALQPGLQHHRISEIIMQTTHILYAATLTLSFGMVSNAPARAELFTWTQYTHLGLEARAVTDASTCPVAKINGTAVPMVVRAAPGPDYAITTCAVAVPPDATSLSIAATPLALPAATGPKRIAVIGDTGCRLKGPYLQACNDPAQWPFELIADRLALAKPDLIIHVGDYHYRESACPLNIAACAGSPYGDNWDTWRADFFTPAAALLPVAPWVAIRGNHEDCKRGGKGWSRALEPTPFDIEKGCNGPTPLYTIKLPRLTLAIADTALATEDKLDPRLADEFRPQYAGLAKAGTDPIWLLQHRPIWSAGGTVAGFPYGDNKTLAAAARATLPPTVALMLSGHHHIFQALNYADSLPPQIVSGHGGDYLNAGNSTDPKGWTLNGVTVSSGIHDVGTFGYVIMEPNGDTWRATNYGVDGKVRHRCEIAGRKVTCQRE